MTDSSSKTQIKTDKIHVLTGVLREVRAMKEERIWVKKPRYTYNEVRVITRRVITRYDSTAINNEGHFLIVRRGLGGVRWTRQNTRG